MFKCKVLQEEEIIRNLWVFVQVQFHVVHGQLSLGQQDDQAVGSFPGPGAGQGQRCFCAERAQPARVSAVPELGYR